MIISAPSEVGAVMEKLRTACVLDWKFNNKIKELRLSQFLHYCS